jgi:hypothetical protein
MILYRSFFLFLKREGDGEIEEERQIGVSE